MFRIFVQARMSSKRFPGKVLAPLHGKPIIMHLLENIMHVVDKKHIVVLTSDEQSDDPLVNYLSSLEFNVFRGNLENTFLRFQDALHQFECEEFVRLCADSPLFDSRLISLILSRYFSNESPDLVTNVFPRTFPKGLSIELIKTSTFLAINNQELSESEREHVTEYFYNRAEKFNIVNLENNEKYSFPAHSCVVDSIEDYKDIEIRIASNSS